MRWMVHHRPIVVHRQPSPLTWFVGLWDRHRYFPGNFSVLYIYQTHTFCFHARPHRFHFPVTNRIYKTKCEWMKSNDSKRLMNWCAFCLTRIRCVDRWHGTMSYCYRPTMFPNWKRIHRHFRWTILVVRSDRGYTGNWCVTLYFWLDRWDTFPSI